MTAVISAFLLNPKSVPINNYHGRMRFTMPGEAVSDPLKIIIFANYLKFEK
jgi:hypothetical protein